MNRTLVQFFIIVSCLTFLFPSSGPNSGGTFTSDNSLLAGFAWSNPSNAGASDNQYATVSGMVTDDNTAALVATNFGFSLPASTITNITVEYEVKTTDESGDAPTNTLTQLCLDGVLIGINQSTGSEWPFDTDTYINVSGVLAFWDNTLTYSDINNSTFGFAIAAQAQNNTNATAYVDHMRMTIDYTVAGGKKPFRVIGYGNGVTKTETLNF